MKRLFLPVLLLCITLTSYAQQKESAFFSASFGAGNGGGAGSAQELRQRTSPSIVLSTSFGLPLFNQVFLYTKLSYISKSNYTSQEYNNFSGSDFGVSNELIQANASFSQLIFNSGLQYNFYLSSELTLAINGGLTYALVNHQASLPNGTVLQKLDNEGVFGAFSGLSLEKSFKDSNVSLFGEAQYNYAKKDMVYFRDKFSGMNFTVGGRYYFNDGN